uniref:Neural cell adhesion molecule L1 n=1 Tax=Scleropages formosus TaxID=113540 RepID=A0A8C9S2H0_SCLFO
MLSSPLLPSPVEQLPTITQQAPRLLIAFPFDESYTFECKARGNPEPEYHWTKNGFRFDPRQDPRLIMEDDAGSFTIPSGKNITQYGGRYRCYASNRLGTAVSEETQFIVSNSPKFPKEKIDPIVVEDGQSVVLECNPPSGIPPRTIYWMTIGLKQIEQNQRVSTGLDGNLYFSNTLEEDSREDYCCFASFPSIPTIVQKTPMAMLVRSRNNSTVQRKPSLMAPSGVQTQVRLVKGEDLQLECMAEGFPTPVVTWTKSGENLPNHSSIENFRKRLVIPKINKDNEGIYVCKAENSAGETTHEFHVTVEEPPHWLVKPESQLKSSGSDVHLQCSAAGNPQPEITWMMNGHLLKDAPEFGGQLAVYQCQASNRHGTLLVNVNVMVLDLGPLILTEDRKKYEAVVGTTVLLHCKVFSSPPSVTTWWVSALTQNFYIQEDGSLKIHNVQKEDAGEYTCFSINSQGNATILASLDIKETIVKCAVHVLCVRVPSELIKRRCDEPCFGRYFVEENVLHITNVSHSDQGTYQCVVRTSLDQDLASALLIVQGVPDAPEHLELYEPDNRRVKLKWVPGDDHNSTTTEFIVEYEESRWEPGRWRELQRVSGNQTWAQLDLNGHLDYQFRVSALSAIGRGPPSRPTERYKTPATAPDSSPSNIKSEGNLPHEMIIHWEPLLPVEHNGPGLEYKVSYRQQGVEEDWQEHMVKRHSLVVKNTPPYVPYDVKVQAANDLGWAPEPKVYTVYSGEDLPDMAPSDVAVTVLNSSRIHVSWTPVPVNHVWGLLGGYKVSVHTPELLHSKETMVISGNLSYTTVQGLIPFSEYSLMVGAFNGRGMGPSSHPVTFKTPEGVPEKISILKATNAQKDAITLVWSPPLKAHGVLTGYLLQYQMVNDTADFESLHNVTIRGPDSTQWVLKDLETVTRYRFYVSACTRVGCGPPVSEESQTTPTGEVHFMQDKKPIVVSANYPEELNCNNCSRSHAGLAVKSESSDPWFIGSMCAAVALTLVVLIACFVRRNIGGKYSVKEKEDARSDVQSQGATNNASSEYSDNEKKPLKASLCSLKLDSEENSCGVSMTDSEDEDDRFGEDGSFIGEYAGHKRPGSTEANGAALVTA